MKHPRLEHHWQVRDQNLSFPSPRAVESGDKEVEFWKIGMELEYEVGM